jgi:glycosyltransferase involved in cell wall biosynthesis
MTRLLFVSHLSEFSGGGELSLFAILEYLKSKDYDLHVVFPSAGAFSEKLNELNISYSIVDYVWSISRFAGRTKDKNSRVARMNANAVLSFAGVIEKFAPDVVITNTIVAPWGMYVAKALGVPNIIFIREWVGQRNFPVMAPTMREYLRNIDAIADWIVYNSDYTKRMYQSYLNCENSSVIYPSIQLDKSTIAEWYRENKITEELSILIAGTIAKDKNQIEALEAIKLALAKGVKIVEVQIVGNVGDQAYYDSVKRLITDAQLKGIVRIEKFSPDIFKIMNDHNIVILPSIAEAFGRVTLEAQLFGRLVIGSNAGGTKELITDKVTGLLYESGNVRMLADMIEWVANNAKDAESIAKRAMREQAEKFLSQDRLAPLESIFERLIEDNTNSARQGCFDPVAALIEKVKFDNTVFEHTLSGMEKERDQTKDELCELQDELCELQDELLGVREQLEGIARSRSYRLGRALLAPPRFVKKLIDHIFNSRS